MAVYPGEKHRSGGRTVRRSMIIRKAQALLRQSAQAWCIDLASIGRNVGIAQIICQNQYNVRAYHARLWLSVFIHAIHADTDTTEAERSAARKPA